MENNNNILTEITGNEKKAWVAPAITDEAFKNTQSGPNAFKLENSWYHS